MSRILLHLYNIGLRVNLTVKSPFHCFVQLGGAHENENPDST